jgi:hypothetical protein
MRDYLKTFGANSPVRFNPRDVDLKSFGKETLYFTFVPGFRDTIRKGRKARAQILGVDTGLSPNVG